MESCFIPTIGRPVDLETSKGNKENFRIVSTLPCLSDDGKLPFPDFRAFAEPRNVKKKLPVAAKHREF
jgi:hypothetical protein